MKNRSNFALSAFRGGLATTALIALAAILVASSSSAQQPAPKAQPKAQQKEAPAPAPQQQREQQSEQPQVIYTPWTKVCQTGPDGKKVCFTGKGGRVESGLPVVGAVVIEPEGGGKKLLRVTLPLGMALPPGTRVIIDQGQPMTGPYVICVAAGCMADYEVSDDLLATMRSSQSLHVQGINEAGQPISIPLPLADFAKAYDAPPTDPKKVEEQQKQLQDELQKRAEDARKRLEGRQPAPASPK